MKKTLMLTVALAAALSAVPTRSYAQVETGGVDSSAANTRAARKAKQTKEGKQAPLFPSATRSEPAQEGSKSVAKRLAKLFDLQQDGKNDEVIAGADELLANGSANAFDRSNAAYLAGYAWMAKDTDSYTHAIEYLQRALSENGLSNNTHYQVMLQVAQMQLSEEKYADAEATAEKFLAETKSNDPRALALQGNALYRLERYQDSVDVLKKVLASSDKPDDNLVRLLIANYLELNKPQEAAAVIEGLLARKPDDKALMQNLASVYQQADQDAKAGQVIDRMRAAGMLTESKDYEVAYRLLANIEGREKDAVALIQEGFAKGILQPNYDAYAYLGNAYYAQDQVPQAIDAWAKAAPLAKDGEMYLNLAKLQASEERWADAKASANQALAKGVKRKGDAWIVIGRAEYGMGNKNAVLSAYREAAKYPETKKAAEAALRQAAGK